MASSGSSEYMIFHPEKVGLFDIFCVLFLRKPLSSSRFIECHTEDTKLLQTTLPHDIRIIITLIIQKILSLIRTPLQLFCQALEFVFNLFSLNNGLFGMIFRIITCSLVIPKRGSKDYQSSIGLIDGRKDLYKVSSLDHLYNLCGTIGSIDIIGINKIGVLDLCMMAAKISYENQAYVENVVTKHWQMHFVGFYNFWNVFQKTYGTQAFIFCDAAKHAKQIFVAFRGTKPFNAQDWSTDVDLSWLSMGKMGRVHLGDMKALGLQNDKDYQKGWPKDYRGSKDLAYYTIREKLKTLRHQNMGARIIITGHSLGGALATLFPSVLMLHQETTILNSLDGVYTFGQPRVGDKDFGEMMNAVLNVPFKRYNRMVYRFDALPRVPFDNRISQFSHFGDCLYFSSWYKGKVMKKQPDDNYFSLLYIIPKYFSAWVDLFRGLFAWIKPGRDFKEGLTSILFRLMGLIFPGVASHSPRDYVNAARLPKIKIKEIEEHEMEYMCDFL